MKRKIVNLMWGIFWIGLVLFSGLVLALNNGWMGDMPSMKELENPSAAVASEVYAADGSLLGKFFITNRSNSTYDEISPNVINALVATEDARFEENSGIDGVAVMRAVLLLGKKGGGSTITQQLAKNLFPRENVSKFNIAIIKLKEWIMAVKLERNLTKEEIITLYLNTVPFPDNTYGIKNASLTFFSKDPKDLTVEEAAVLVGTLKGNTLYNPRRNPERSLDRRNTVIDQMVKYNYLSSAEANTYKSKPLVLKYEKQTFNTGIAPYFRQVLEQEIKKWCKANEKENGEQYNVYRDGLKIYTTIDPKLQRYAEEAVEEQMKDLQPVFASQPYIKSGSIWKQDVAARTLKRVMQESDRYRNLLAEGIAETEITKSFNEKTQMTVFTWANADHKKDTIMTPMDSIKYMRSYMQAGFMVMDPYTGEIKAWVGGIDHDYFKYDHVNISTKRQVGSTMKPLLYCLAVDNGYSPCSSVSTAAQKFAGQKNYYNAGGSRNGSMTMQNALAQSVNNASLYLLNQVGIKPFVNFAHTCGISSTIPELPSIALGAAEISLFEMLWSYTMFPSGGVNTEPMMISKIEDKHGRLLKNFVPKQRQIINDNTAGKMVKMMQGVVDHGTAKRLRYRFGIEGDLAGKTGTTNGQADAWFIGYSPELLAGAWVGNDDRFLRFQSTALGQGAAAAAPIWGHFFKKVFADPTSGYKPTQFIFPEGFSMCGDEYGNSAGGGTTYYEEEREVVPTINEQATPDDTNQSVTPSTTPQNEWQ